MEVRVYVQLKAGILDPQGKAVAGALRQLGFALNDARVGREIILDVDAGDGNQALALAEEMCGKLLANPVIEDFRCELGEGQ